jgi:hypothetical protein
MVYPTKEKFSCSVHRYLPVTNEALEKMCFSLSYEAGIIFPGLYISSNHCPDAENL